MKKENQLPANRPKPQITALSKQLTEDLIKDKVSFKITAHKLTSTGAPDFKAIIDHGTQISVIKSNEGDARLCYILGLLINDFAASFNTIRPMTDDQVADLSIELMTDLWAYKLEDFVAFFQLAKKGVYGRVLDRMDSGTINAMLIPYEADRVRFLQAEQISRQETKDNLNPYINTKTAARGVSSVAGAISNIKDAYRSLPLKTEETK